MDTEQTKKLPPGLKPGRAIGRCFTGNVRALNLTRSQNCLSGYFCCTLRDVHPLDVARPTHLRVWP
jgi:hypothetical protein